MAKTTINNRQKAFLEKAYADFTEIRRSYGGIIVRKDWNNYIPECAPSRDYDKFELKKGESPKPIRKICAQCPLFFVCVEHELLSGNEETAIRAGMTQRQRKGLRTAIGAERLHAIAELTPGHSTRERFFEVTTAVASFLLLGEISEAEATEQIFQTEQQITLETIETI